MTQARPATVDRARRLARLGRETALTVGAVLGLLCILATVLAVVLDVRPVVFRSGSMAPAIDTGALALSRTVDAGDLAVGDVVTVRDESGTRVTHRIRSLTRTGDQATLVLKGDANSVADASPYVVESVDRVVLDVPLLGYVVSALSGRAGTFGGGLLVGLLLTTVLRRRHDDDATEPATEPAGPVQVGPPVAAPVRAPLVPAGRRRVLTVLAVVGLAVLLAGTRSTSAAWTDDATVVSGSFSMRANPVVPVPPTAPLVTSCVRSGNAITLTWVRSLNATSYQVTYTNPGGRETVPGPGGATITYQTVNANFNNSTGTIRVVAVNANGTTSSNSFAYSGNGSNGVCIPSP